LIVIESHIVSSEELPSRLYEYSQSKFTVIPSRKGIKKAIDKGAILVNGEETGTGLWLKKGDKVQLVDPQKTPPKPFPMKLEVVYEDEHIAVINKPAGIVVSGNLYETVVNCLQENLKPSIEKDKLPWPKPVHRLDKQTSGLLIIAKTSLSLMKLGQMFENKEITKTYHAISSGEIKASGVFSLDISGQKALTEYELVTKVKSIKNDFISLVKLSPKTGRTHQLRIHLAENGTPIMGDKLYGIEGNILLKKGLFLHASELEFNHPVKQNKLKINIPIPSKFGKLLQREEMNWINKNK
jgi:23S rRNA pseudouridine1911/1915/1917 synthase